MVLYGIFFKFVLIKHFWEVINLKLEVINLNPDSYREEVVN
jgi:hypothetical protein